MPLYEHVFMTRQDVSAAQVESLTETFKTIIEQGGGKVTKSEYWGVRPLSYRIKKNRKAHYSLINIDAPSQAVAEMERQQNISDDVIRILTLKVKQHEDGPSVMMQQRSSRDDKRGGFRRDGPRDGARHTPRDGAPKPGDTKPGDAKPSDAKPSDAKPSDAKPSDAKPGDAKPAEDKKPAAIDTPALDTKSDDSAAKETAQ